jgi:hypothetical protein
MRFYPIHVIVKDVSFIFLYISLSDLFEQNGIVSLPPMPFFSFNILLLLIIGNLILQSIIYFGFNRFIRFKKNQQKFLFAVALHIPTILFWIGTISTTESTIAWIVATIVSGGISGMLYVMLNRQVRRELITENGARTIDNGEWTMENGQRMNNE